MKFATDIINRGYIDIYGHRVKIEISDTLLTDSLLGKANYTTNTISLSSHQSEANKKDTLLHEPRSICGFVISN